MRISARNRLKREIKVGSEVGSAVEAFDIIVAID